jgi:hypothetical protein
VHRLSRCSFGAISHKLDSTPLTPTILQCNFEGAIVSATALYSASSFTSSAFNRICSRFVASLRARAAFSSSSVCVSPSASSILEAVCFPNSARHLLPDCRHYYHLVVVDDIALFDILCLAGTGWVSLVSICSNPSMLHGFSDPFCSEMLSIISICNRCALMFVLDLANRNVGTSGD